MNAAPGTTVDAPPGTSVKVRLGGSRVDVTTTPHLGALLRTRLRDRSAPQVFLASANLDHVRHFGARSGRSHVFDEQPGVEWRVLLDGMPLVWAARRLTGVRVPLLAGSDLLEPVLEIAEQEGARVGLLGGSLQMHAAFRERLAAEHPGVGLVCALSPSRVELADPRSRTELAAQVRAAEVDVLVVALGKPRQEEFLLECGTATGARVGVAFGAAADFYAGTAKRAVERVRGTGLEWLYRLVHEPRRLGGRYLVRGPADMRQLLRESGLWVPGLASLLEQEVVVAAPVPGTLPSMAERGRERRTGDRRAAERRRRVELSSVVMLPAQERRRVPERRYSDSATGVA